MAINPLSLASPDRQQALFPAAPVQDWLQLLHITGLSAGIRQHLLAVLGTPAAILEATETVLVSLGLEAELAARIRASNDANSEASLRTQQALNWQAQKQDRHLILASDSGYPPLLRQIDDPPPLLYVQGNPVALLRPMIAIVGSRNCSQYGLTMASQLAADLAHMGLVVCSGLAYGIDASAHRAAVRVGKTTVAVLGNGLNSIYPKSHGALANSIIEGPQQFAGALVSELPLDAGPHANHFPRRNRIISGMSLGVCVVEAVLRSGSLITARLALEQNRDVFAVPGSVNNTRSRGCHQLIRDGAVLVESASDIVSHLESLATAQHGLLQLESVMLQRGDVQQQREGVMLPRKSVQQQRDNVQSTQCEITEKLLALLSDDPMSLDVLQTRARCSIAELTEALLLLELDQRAINQGGRWAKGV